jgi:hypothetical protein
MAIRIFFFELLELLLSLDLLELSSEPQATKAADPQTSTPTSNHRIKFCFTYAPSSGGRSTNCAGA